eukprot:Nitzschia sp. Nitz4//scaffold231_size31564//27935//28873//NITZ4_007944-RA/size31564-processed-gene-0.32-mRNA-1//1//CDS//3329543305//2855//frame0
MPSTNDIFCQPVHLEPTIPWGEEPWGAERVVQSLSAPTIKPVPDIFAGVSLDFLVPEEDTPIVPSSPTSSMEFEQHMLLSTKARFQQIKDTAGLHNNCRVPSLPGIDLLKSTFMSDASESSFSMKTYHKSKKARSSNTAATRTSSRGRSGPAYTLQQAGRWQQRFMELAHFKNEYGHCCVPSHWPQNHSLAQWVKRQRSQRKLKQEGRRSNMTPQREQALTEMGFVWDSHSDVWEERLNELCEYKVKNGHVNVPTRYPENPPLAIWCKRQRRLYKLNQIGEDCRTSISDERIQKLKDLGFDFCPRETEHHRE